MEPEKKANGALVGLAIIIIILVVGGIYVWISSKKTVELQNSQTQSKITSQDVTALDTLEQDITTTDTSAGVDVNAVN